VIAATRGEEAIMRQLVPDVYLFEGLRGANVYLLLSNEGLTLVDSGMSGNADSIAAQLEEAGHSLSQVHSIVLTHTHVDHVGSAAELVGRSGAQILAHRAEVPYIEQIQTMPSTSLFRRLMNWLSDRVLFGATAPHVDRPLDEGDTIEALGGLQVIHTPGHTPGSISLYQPERRIVFCGDALFNANPLTGSPGLRFPLPTATLDGEQARESVAKLSALDVDVLCCGHGEPILGGAGAQIAALLA
jgi:glyoxylase-like metal-dependent hydrolase (beta-lactamase superfamily II)